MKIETLCNIALVAILALAGYGALQTVAGVVSVFSQPPAALITKAYPAHGGRFAPSQYR